MTEWVKSMFDWISANEACINTIIGFLSFIVTSVLAIIVIFQTSKLAKRQSKQELMLTKQQVEMQKRQIRLDTFEYKNNIYFAIHKVFQMTGEYQEVFEKIGMDDLKAKSADKLHLLFDLYREQLKIDVSDTMWFFKQAEYILPSNIYDSVYNIAGNFNELTGDIGKFKLFSTLLTPEEIEPMKAELLEDIKFRSEQINKHVLFINSIMPTELSISSMDK